MSDQFEELLKKHLSGELNEEERGNFSTFLKDPENQLYLASRIDKDFIEEKFILGVNDEVGLNMLNNIQQKIAEIKKEIDIESDKTEENKVLFIPRFRKLIYRSVAVAASVLLIVGTVYLLTNNNRSQEIAQQANNSKLVQKEQHVVNTTGKEKTLNMSDGSLILLANKSEITYNEPFQYKRIIQLKGKAFFKVYKDKSHPFTVISGDIATTALGTQFTVRDFDDEKKIVVRLFEGKVVIRPIDKNNKKMNKEVFLLPGEEFVYGTKKNAVPYKFKVETDSKETHNDRPSLPENVAGAWYMFNNQSLDQVLQNLSAFYDVKIIYNKNDIRNIYFTGKYNNSESLETIIKRIATMNSLKVTRKDSAFILTK